MHRVFLPAAVVLLGLAGAAQAHPRLLAASPAPDATVAAPARVTLRFTEKLTPGFSGADLLMIGHGGKTHPPTKVAATTVVGPDGITLVMTPGSPLGAGSYRLAWHVVSTDTHRVAGNYAFTVK